MRFSRPKPSLSKFETSQSWPLSAFGRTILAGPRNDDSTEYPSWSVSASTKGLNDDPGWRPTPPPAVPTARLTLDVFQSRPPTMASTWPSVSRDTSAPAGSLLDHSVLYTAS